MIRISAPKLCNLWPLGQGLGVDQFDHLVKMLLMQYALHVFSNSSSLLLDILQAYLFTYKDKQ